MARVVAEWKKTLKQAHEHQAQADNLYEQVEDLRCPRRYQIHPMGTYRRCVLDVGHPGHHQVPEDDEDDE